MTLLCGLQFEVSFIRMTKSSDVLFAINRAVDLLFACDVLINFNLMYFDETKHRWVSKHPQAGLPDHKRSRTNPLL